MVLQGFYDIYSHPTPFDTSKAIRNFAVEICLFNSKYTKPFLFNKLSSFTIWSSKLLTLREPMTNKPVLKRWILAMYIELYTNE